MIIVRLISVRLGRGSMSSVMRLNVIQTNALHYFCYRHRRKMQYSILSLTVHLTPAAAAANPRSRTSTLKHVTQQPLYQLPEVLKN